MNSKEKEIKVLNNAKLIAKNIGRTKKFTDKVFFYESTQTDVKDWSLTYSEVLDVLKEKNVSVTAKSKSSKQGLFSIGSYQNWYYNHSLFDTLEALKIEIYELLTFCVMNNVYTSIRKHSNGIFGSSPYQSSLVSGAANGGDDVITFLEFQNDVNLFFQTIATYSDESWETVTNEKTGIPLSYLSAQLGDKLCRLELTYSPDNYTETDTKNNGIIEDKVDPQVQKMITMSVNVGGSTFNLTTQIVTISASILSIIPMVMGIYLRGVRKGIQRGLDYLNDDAEGSIGDALSDVDTEASEGADEALDEAIEAGGEALEGLAIDLSFADGFMIGLVAIALVSEVFSLLAHTTTYSFTIENKTKYRIRWSEPDMDHGSMNSGPTDGNGNYEYVMPGLQITSPEGYTPEDYSYTNATFSFIEKTALYGVTGTMNLEFLDEDGSTVETSIIAFNIPYSGTNGLGFSFSADTPSHENPDKVISWTVASPDNVLIVNAGITALTGKHTLPGQADDGYNYSSAIVYTQPS